MSKQFVGGKFKVRNISVYASKASRDFMFDRRNCRVSVTLNSQTFETDKKTVLKGRKISWMNLNFFSGYAFSSILIEKMVVELWDATSDSALSLASATIPLREYSNHLDADLDLTFPFFTSSHEQIGKLVVTGRFSPVKRFDILVGQRVLAKCSGGMGRWHSGRVSADNGDGFYCIDYDDGDYEWNVREDFIKLPQEVTAISSREEESSVFKFEDKYSMGSETQSLVDNSDISTMEGWVEKDSELEFGSETKPRLSGKETAWTEKVDTGRNDTQIFTPVEIGNSIDQSQEVNARETGSQDIGPPPDSLGHGESESVENDESLLNECGEILKKFDNLQT